MSLLKKLVRKVRGPKFYAHRALQHELGHGEPEIRLLPLLANSRGTFIDVGANQGSYALHAVPHFARVVAIEAHPDLARWLQSALKPDVEVIHAALSDAEGMATLHVPVLGENEIRTRCSLNNDANPGFDLRSIDVPMMRLDSIPLDNVSVIKIDVEGHELAVLGGASDTIARCRPVCIVECEERHNANGVARACAFFDQLGYQAWFIHRGRLREGEGFSPAVLQLEENAKSISGGRSPDYINNFVFVPNEDAATIRRLRDWLAT